MYKKEGTVTYLKPIQPKRTIEQPTTQPKSQKNKMGLLRAILISLFGDPSKYQTQTQTETEQTDPDESELDLTMTDGNDSDCMFPTEEF